MINERGWFRLGLAADALDPVTRRPLLGLNEQSTEPGMVSDNLQLGDGVLIEVYRGEELLGSIDQFEQEVVFQGTRYAQGQPWWSFKRDLDMNEIHQISLSLWLLLSQHSQLPILGCGVRTVS